MLKLVIFVGHRSWKNDERVMESHGKIMEFDSGKALGALVYLVVTMRKPMANVH